jgi:ribose transport system ATP-binding protein
VSAGPPRLGLEHVAKTFIGTRALSDLSISIGAGTIHALVGQNGSGKSTLIKILAGYYAPDSGTLTVSGQVRKLPLTPQSAAEIGLRFVHQNLGLVPSTTVLEAVRAGEWQPLRPIRWRREERTVKALLAELGADISPRDIVGRLAPSQRAVVAIVRALQDIRGTESVLVLDEPTASLNRVDAARLFTALRTLRDAGHSILFVSHRLDEVLTVCDHVTVIRDGRDVLDTAVAGLDEQTLVRAIIGRDVDNLYPGRPTPQQQTALELNGLSGEVIRDLSLAVHRREIVGITGLAGMGQDELPYLIFGAQPTRAGTVTLAGPARGPARPRRSVAAGMALVPADREASGSVRVASVGENLTMGVVKRFFRGGLLRKQAENSHVDALLQEFDVYPPRADFAFGALSGGNQQKALLAKWLQSTPSVVLLHEPTQGVDVGSRKQIFRIIRRTADRGAAIAIFSAEYADLAHICNRVIVLRDGAVSAELDGAEMDESQILQACMKGSSQL